MDPQATAVNENGILMVEQCGKALPAMMDDVRANVVSTRLSRELRAVIDEAEADPEIGAIVIAGRPGRFSGGFELLVFQGGDAEAMYEIVAGGALVARIHGSAIPVVASCTGHAVAAGALLSIGCNRRVGPHADIRGRATRGGHRPGAPRLGAGHRRRAP